VIEKRSDRRAPLVPLVALLSVALLGVLLAALWASVRQPFSGLSWTQGTGFVTAVFPGSPAQAAGLRRGDVILTVGGWPMSSVRRSAAAVLSAGIGESLSVTVLRDGKVLSFGLDRVVPPPLAWLHRLEFPLIALCFALLGFAVWAHKPYDRTVVLFLLFTYSIAALLALGALAALRQPSALLGYIGLLSVTSASACTPPGVLSTQPSARRRPGTACTPRPISATLYSWAATGDRRRVYFLALNAAQAYCLAAVLGVATHLLQPTARRPRSARPIRSSSSAPSWPARPRQRCRSFPSCWAVAGP
jgi:hypothetical protein